MEKTINYNVHHAVVDARFAEFFRAPIVKFIEFFLSQFVLVICFAYFLMEKYCDSPHQGAKFTINAIIASYHIPVWMLLYV